MLSEGHEWMEKFLQEVEEGEKLSEKAHIDLLLIEVKSLQGQIAVTFEQADKEVQLIKEWALQKNSRLQDKLERIERVLERFIRESREKTIELPNGVLKMHKKPDKVEIENLELFLQHAKTEMLTKVPESYKPDMAKIKQYVASHMTPPKGIKVTKGQPEFTYKLRKDNRDVGTETETGTESERACED